MTDENTITPHPPEASWTPAALLAGVEEVPSQHPVRGYVADLGLPQIGHMAEIAELRKTMALRLLRDTITKKRGSYLELIRPAGLIKPEGIIVPDNHVIIPDSTDLATLAPEPSTQEEPIADTSHIIKPEGMELDLYSYRSDAPYRLKRFEGLSSFNPEAFRAGEAIPAPQTGQKVFDNAIASRPNHIVLYYEMMGEYVSLHEHLRSFFMKRAKGDKIKEDLDAIIEASVSIIKKVDEKQLLAPDSSLRPKDVVTVIFEHAMDEAYNDFMNHLAKRREERGGVDFNNELIFARLHSSFEELLSIIDHRLEMGKKPKDKGLQ